MSDDKSPDQVRKINLGILHRLKSTARQLRKDGHDGLAKEYEDELHILQDHHDYVSRFANRMQFGSSVPNHPEKVMDWLIETGWTPPDYILLNDTATEDEESSDA